jgi:hypothetical protein
MCVLNVMGGAGGVAPSRGELQLDMCYISCFLALGRGGNLWRQEGGGGQAGEGSNGQVAVHTYTC